MNKVKFYTADRKFIFKNKTRLKEFINGIFEEEGKHLHSINYIFCSDDYLLKINQKFLKHDYYTDVITFNLSEKKNDEIEAEVYISIDRLRDNAVKQRATIKKESLRVIFHAALHLCGYNDKMKSEILMMRKKEEHYLSLFL